MLPKPVLFLRGASQVLMLFLVVFVLLSMSGCMSISADHLTETASAPVSSQTSAQPHKTEAATDATSSQASQTTKTVEVSTLSEPAEVPRPSIRPKLLPSPSAEPTASPSPEPTQKPTKTPTKAPTKAPTSTPKPYTSPYYLYAEKGSFTLVAYQRGSDGKFSQIARIMRMAIGRGYMTPSGKFTLTTREVWHTFGPTTYGHYATKYSGRLYIHGPCYFSKNIHDLDPDYYNTIGTKDTSGCLRLTSGDAYWVYKNCPSGTIVEIVTGSPRGFTAPALPPIVVEGEDPTDPQIKQTQVTSTPTPTFTPTPEPTPTPTFTPTPDATTAESTSESTTVEVTTSTEASTETSAEPCVTA